MRKVWSLKLSCLILLTLLMAASANAADAGQAAQPFLGRWDMVLKAADHEYPSWLEITEEAGQLHARMTGRWGNPRPLPRVELSNGRLTFVSPKEDEGSKEDLTFKGALSGARLAGTVNAPEGGEWKWTAEKAPELKRSTEPKWGKPMPLFNGKDLTGWKQSDPAAKTAWHVENETLISPGRGPELISDKKFQDFKLHVEFNCEAGANSGVYLRGRYELQIENDATPEGPSMRTGGVYGFLSPTPEQPRRPGEWQSYDITLIGRTVTVQQNGITIIDKQEIPGLTGGALDSLEGEPGPIYLQGSEAGHVAFRNITITEGR